MSEQRGGGSGGRLMPVLATACAMYLARKAITMAWTRTTGKVPPTDPADPSVSMVEALSWAAIAGITVEAARLLATRATIRHAVAEGGDAEPS